MFLSRSPKAAGLGRRQGGDGDVKEKGSSLDLGEVWCPSSTDLCRSPTALQLRLSGGRSDMSSLKAQRHRRGQNSTQIKGLWDYYATLTMECAIFFFNFICGCTGSWLLREGFLSCDWRGLLSSCSAVASLVVEKGSRVQTLECRLSSCGTWA